MPSARIVFTPSLAAVELELERYTALLSLRAADEEGVEVWTQARLSRADLLALHTALGRVLATLSPAREGASRRDGSAPATLAGAQDQATRAQVPAADERRELNAAGATVA